MTTRYRRTREQKSFDNTIEAWDRLPPRLQIDMARLFYRYILKVK
jgi:hypothetical protein